MKNLDDDFYRLNPKQQKQCEKLKHELESILIKYDSEVRLAVLPEYCCDLFYEGLDCDKETFLKAMGMSWDKLQGEYE